MAVLQGLVGFQVSQVDLKWGPRQAWVSHSSDCLMNEIDALQVLLECLHLV